MIGIKEGLLEEQGSTHLNYGSHLSVGKILGHRGARRCPRRCPHLLRGAAEDREPEMTLSYNHTDEYLAYQHRTFIWRSMEIETETHTRAPD